MKNNENALSNNEMGPQEAVKFIFSYQPKENKSIRPTWYPFHIFVSQKLMFGKLFLKIICKNNLHVAHGNPVF